MMEEILLNYGVAGAMLVYFISDKVFFQRNMQKVVENNTVALTKFYEMAKVCGRKQKV